MKSLIEELATDIMCATEIGHGQAIAIADYLVGNGIVDYDTLKEYYLDEENE